MSPKTLSLSIDLKPAADRLRAAADELDPPGTDARHRFAAIIYEAQWGEGRWARAYMPDFGEDDQDTRVVGAFAAADAVLALTARDVRKGADDGTDS